jgi:hypothetical protein
LSSSISDSVAEEELETETTIAVTADELTGDPDEAWKLIKDKHIFETPPHTSCTKDPDAVRFISMSDTHGKHCEVGLFIWPIPRAPITCIYLLVNNIRRSWRRL